MNKLLILLLVVFTFACTSKKSGADRLPFYNSASFDAEWDFGGKIHQIPGFSFTNQQGKEVTEETFGDKIYVADFFFTACPGICPKLTANMTLLQEAFADENEVLLLSHTVTPWRDSVEVLQEYGENWKIDPQKWHLVTGEQEEIYNIARKSYFAELEAGIDKPLESFLHTENFLLIDKNRRIRGVYNGTIVLEVERLIEDIQTLMREG